VKDSHASEVIVLLRTSLLLVASYFRVAGLATSQPDGAPGSFRRVSRPLRQKETKLGWAIGHPNSVRMPERLAQTNIQISDGVRCPAKPLNHRRSADLLPNFTMFYRIHFLRSYNHSLHIPDGSGRPYVYMVCRLEQTCSHSGLAASD